MQYRFGFEINSIVCYCKILNMYLCSICILMFVCEMHQRREVQSKRGPGGGWQFLPVYWRQHRQGKIKRKNFFYLTTLSTHF